MPISILTAKDAPVHSAGWHNESMHHHSVLTLLRKQREWNCSVEPHSIGGRNPWRPWRACWNAWLLWGQAYQPIFVELVIAGLKLATPAWARQIFPKDKESSWRETDSSSILFSINLIALHPHRLLTTIQHVCQADGKPTERSSSEWEWWWLCSSSAECSLVASWSDIILGHDCPGVWLSPLGECHFSGVWNSRFQRRDAH